MHVKKIKLKPSISLKQLEKKLIGKKFMRL